MRQGTQGADRSGSPFGVTFLGIGSAAALCALHHDCVLPALEYNELAPSLQASM